MMRYTKQPQPHVHIVSLEALHSMAWLLPSLTDSVSDLQVTTPRLARP